MFGERCNAMTWCYRFNGTLRIEFTFAGYDCEIELDNNGITTVEVDSLQCFEFSSDTTLAKVQEVVCVELLYQRSLADLRMALFGIS